MIRREMRTRASSGLAVKRFKRGCASKRHGIRPGSMFCGSGFDGSEAGGFGMEFVTW